ncbi:MAG: hypothetical protein HY598_02005 [Candidatus Omnitrophica bacterium]|nr:hypothetical protein [Candidatus Omnitrophota bacterium]
MMYGGAGYLIAAAAGYLVLERSEKHKGMLQRIGRWVGVAIIVVSFVGLACAVQCGRGGWGMKRMGMCPLSGRTAPAP